jgi:hypothetical protein
MALDFKRLSRWPQGSQPWRDVAVALCIKLGLLAALYLLFFSPADRPPSDASATARALVGTSNLREFR